MPLPIPRSPLPSCARTRRAGAQVEEARAAREAAEARAAEASAPPRPSAGGRKRARARVAGSAKPAAAAPAPPAGPSGAQLAGYAISRYPDVPDVYRRLGDLVSRPIRPIRRDVMDGYLGWFDENCRRSKELTDEAMEVIPGGVQHNLAFNYPFPLAIEKAEGAHLWDVDGNEYIDFLQAGGPTVLGSNYAPLREKVAEVVEQSGPVTGLFHEYELKLAQLVSRLMPACEQFRMLGSGTESVMAAIRGARAFTGKKWVVKFGGAYHGWSDQMVYGLHVPGTWRFEAKGIPFGATAAHAGGVPQRSGRAAAAS